jgi:hypothetical protein
MAVDDIRAKAFHALSEALHGILQCGNLFRRHRDPFYKWAPQLIAHYYRHSALQAGFRKYPWAIDRYHDVRSTLLLRHGQVRHLSFEA